MVVSVLLMYGDTHVLSAGSRLIDSKVLRPESEGLFRLLSLFRQAFRLHASSITLFLDSLLSRCHTQLTSSHPSVFDLTLTGL